MEKTRYGSARLDEVRLSGIKRKKPAKTSAKRNQL
jgi:hypothetical protein